MDKAAAQLAFGRIMRMASRSEQDGDTAEYFRCRAIIFEALEAGDIYDRSPSFAADYGKGDQSQWV